MKKKVFDIIKKIVASAVFLSILFTVLVQMSYLFRYEEKEKSVEILNHFYAEDKNTVDVAFVGSSGIYRFFIPALMHHETGITSAMYAYPAFPFEVTKFAIDEFEKTQSPKLYVVEIRRLYSELNYAESGNKKDLITTKLHHISGMLSGMPVSLNRAGVINKTITKYTDDNELDWQFEYMRTHYNWKDLKLNDIIVYLNNHFLKRDEYKEQNKNKYKVSRMATGVEPMKKPDLSSFTAERTMSKEDLEPLDELLDYISKKNLNVLFITTPFPISETANAYETFVQNYLAEKGIPYLDCNEYYDEIGLDFSTDFYDNKHTNLAGSIKFTKFISSYIAEHFNLQPTELNEKMKGEWTNAYTLWNDEIAIPGLKKIKEGK